MMRNKIVAMATITTMTLGLGQFITAPITAYADSSNIDESWGANITDSEKNLIRNIILNKYQDITNKFNSTDFNDLFNNSLESNDSLFNACGDINNYINTDISDIYFFNSDSLTIADTNYICQKEFHYTEEADYNADNTKFRYNTSFIIHGSKSGAGNDESYKFTMKLTIPENIVTRTILDSKYLTVEQDKYTVESYNNFKNKLDSFIDKMHNTTTPDIQLERQDHYRVETAYNNLVLKPVIIEPEEPGPTTEQAVEIIPEPTTGQAVEINPVVQEENNNVREREDKEKSKETGWTERIKGSFYIKKGEIVKGWFTWWINGETYYLDEITGIKTIGWRCIDGKWYYFDKDGHRITGWLKDNNKIYYLSEEKENLGVRHTGWLNIDGSSYYFIPDGSVAKGWTRLNNDWYYMNINGRMLTGWQCIGENNKWYYFGDDGIMKSNCYINGYKLSDSGEMI